MHDYGLTADQAEFQQAAARVARELYGPKAAEWDRNSSDFPGEERRRLGELGYLGIALPELYGGGGAPVVDALIAIEELAKVRLTPPFRCSSPTPARPRWWRNSALKPSGPSSCPR